MDNEHKPTTRSVERLLHILECFNEDNKQLGALEISKLTGLATATIYRIMQTLVARDYILQDPVSKKYQIGPHFLFLSQLFLAQTDLLKTAQPYLQHLCDIINETVKLYVITGEQRVCLARLQSKHRLQDRARVGEVLSLDRGAGGKIILAYSNLPRGKAENENFDAIRRRGYAINHSERVDGLSSIGFPLFMHNAKVVGSFVIVVPNYRFDTIDLPLYTGQGLITANAISKAMGYPADSYL